MCRSASMSKVKKNKTSKGFSMNWRFVDEFEVTDDVLITVGYALSYLVAYSCISIQEHGISNALNAKGLNVLFVMQRKIHLIWVYPMQWCINGSVCALYFIHMLCENVNVNVVSGTICSPINIPINNLQFQLTLPRALISSVASCTVPINQLIIYMRQMSFLINCHGRWVHELWKRWSPGWHEHFISYLYPVRLWFYAPNEVFKDIRLNNSQLKRNKLLIWQMQIDFNAIRHINKSNFLFYITTRW